jgi:hypothetical protein
VKTSVRDMVRRERWSANETAQRYLVWSKEATLLPHPDPADVWTSIVFGYVDDFWRFFMERTGAPPA